MGSLVALMSDERNVVAVESREIKGSAECDTKRNLTPRTSRRSGSSDSFAWHWSYSQQLFRNA